MKRVLIIGGDGRAHVFARRLKDTSTEDIDLYCAPGNGGMDAIAQCYPEVKAGQIDMALALAKKIQPDLTIVSPEAPICAGVVRLFSDNKLRIVGPGTEQAQLEGSKWFAKKFMWKYGIPTADACSFTDPNSAIAFVKKARMPVVIKGDGLAGGKAVTVAQTIGDAIKAIEELMVEKKHWPAGKRILVEKALAGPECSYIVLADGTNVVPLLPATDFKRRFDGDKGSNTGGMGFHSPVPALTPELEERVMREIVLPTIHGMAEEGMPYHGFLYFGLMLTSDGPKVLEFNVREGDPEAGHLSLLKSNLYELLLASTIPNGLRNMKAEWHKGVAVGVNLVHKYYPEKSSHGKIITGIFAAEETGALVFQAGTQRIPVKGEDLGVCDSVTDGGRIVCVVGRGETFAQARTIAYLGAGRIWFDEMDYRKDIAAKV